MSPTRRAEAKTRTIPGVILGFLERASVAIGCTRSRDRVPRVHYVSGWQVDPDQRSIWGFVPGIFAPGLAETLAEKGPFALTIEHIGPHECYQFKGRLVGMRPAVDADRAVTARCRARFSAAVRGLLPHLADKEPALRAYILDPELAVHVAVGEIFVQTPGPAAGSLLARLEEAP